MARSTGSTCLCFRAPTLTRQFAIVGALAAPMRMCICGRDRYVGGPHMALWSRRYGRQGRPRCCSRAMARCAWAWSLRIPARCGRHLIEQVRRCCSGRNNLSPIVVVSKSQNAVGHSSTESAVLALECVQRSERMPAHCLGQHVLSILGERAPSKYPWHTRGRTGDASHVYSIERRREGAPSEDVKGSPGAVHVSVRRARSCDS